MKKNCAVKVIVGLHEGYEFANLDEAKKVFPELNPDVNGTKFTWAMHDKVNGLPAMRFENLGNGCNIFSLTNRPFGVFNWTFT